MNSFSQSLSTGIFPDKTKIAKKSHIVSKLSDKLRAMYSIC